MNCLYSSETTETNRGSKHLSAILDAKLPVARLAPPMRNRNDPNDMLIAAEDESVWKAAARDAAVDRIGGRDRRPGRTRPSLFEARANALKHFPGRNCIHQTRIELGAATLYFVQPCTICIRISCSVEFLKQGAQQAFLLGTIQAPNFLFYVRDCPCHSAPSIDRCRTRV